MKSQVAGTNDCSIHSKHSIVANGYVHDPYLGYFVDKINHRRSPIINRGYYVRHRAIEDAFERLLLPSSENENHSSTIANVVITLGAGFDTSALRYRSKTDLFIELDYPSVCRRKAEILARNSLIPPEDRPRFACVDEKLDYANETETEQIVLQTDRYLLIGADLRRTKELSAFLRSKQALLRSLINCAKSKVINFILFNECSLCYIDIEDGNELIRSLMQDLSGIFSPAENNHSTNISFTYLGYEMLRSQSVNNGFGRFLLAHFESLGAGILTWLDESEIERRFVDCLAFDSVEVINMKHYWRQRLSSAQELARLTAIEPFDEWEELDSVCASYALTIARKNYDVNCQKNNLELMPDCNNNVSLKSQNIPKQECLLPANKIYPDLYQVFGHCSIRSDDNNRSIRVFGGFGLELKDGFQLNSDSGDDMKSPINRFGHRRCANIVELQFSDDDSNEDIAQVKVWRPRSNRSAIARVHSQVVSLFSNENINSERPKYLLSGGRASPSAPQPNAIVELDPDLGLYDLKIESELNQTNDGQTSKIPSVYRHVCTRFGSNNHQQLIQFGGISSGNAENSVYLFDVSTCKWVETSISNGFNSTRHSMASVGFGSYSILINGGLGLGRNEFRPEFGRFECIDHRELTVHSWQVRNWEKFQFQPLYGHRMTPVSGNEHQVLVFGGIGRDRIENCLYRVDLRTQAIVQRITLEIGDGKLKTNQNINQAKLLMMHNFTVEPLWNSGKVCLIGGGGNCFSFGTHFNPTLIYMM